MKRTFLLMLIIQLAGYSIVAGQITDNTFLLETNLNFSRQNQGIPSSSNVGGISTIPLNVGETLFSSEVNVGYTFFPNFIAGIGIGYHRQRRKSEIRNVYTTGSAGQTSIYEEVIDLVANGFVPKIFFRYNFEIWDNLYFVPQFEASYAHYKETLKNWNGITVVGNPGSQPTIHTEDSKRNLLDFNLSALVMYRFNSWGGVQVKTFNLGLTHLIKDSRSPAYNHDSFTLTFNPAYWEYGLIFFF